MMSICSLKLGHQLLIDMGLESIVVDRLSSTMGAIMAERRKFAKVAVVQWPRGIAASRLPPCAPPLARLLG